MFFVSAAVTNATNVGQSFFAEVRMLCQLKFKIDESWVLVFCPPMNLENAMTSFLMMSHITWTEDNLATILALNSFRNPFLYLE